MKTISGHCVSVKDISLSKAAKILSKFVSADNGASHAINAYLHRASAAFSELNQLHKELESSPTKKKHKRPRTETGSDSGWVVENSVNEDSHGHVKSDEFRKQRIGSGNVGQDDEKSAQKIVKSSQERNGSIEHQTQNVGGREKHSKNRKSDNVEGRPEDRSGDITKKKMKRKHNGDL